MRTVGLVGWLVIAVGFVAVEVTGRRSTRVPTFAQLLDALRRPLAGRIVVAVLWLALGWHLFVQPPAT